MTHAKTNRSISLRKSILPFLLIVILCCWWWDRSQLNSDVSEIKNETTTLSSQMTEFKRTAVRRFLNAQYPTDRSINIELWSKLSDTVYSQPPQNKSANLLWEQVSEEISMHDLLVYHVHFPDWDDDPTRLSPRDYHFFVRENEVVALGIAQGVVGQIAPKPWSTVFDL